MPKNHDKNASLRNVKVLDLAGPIGVYCSKLFADLGADVIKIEPPGGDPSRNVGPFYHNEVHPEKSLYWFHFNTNKRSITLNINTPEGRELFKKLIKTADILIETFTPGQLDKLGLGYELLQEINPKLIQTSITAFGQTGPWRNYKSSDLVGSAISGLSYICGWPDLPPLHLAASQAYHQVSVQAATGTLIALYHRIKTGKGQKVDVSMHRAVVASLMTTAQHYFNTGIIRIRCGNDHELPHFGLYSCRDGYVDFRFRDDRWESLVEWLDSAGMAEDLKEEKWKDPMYRRQDEAKKHINQVIQKFLCNRSKREIYEVGQERGLEIGSIYTSEDVVQDPQLAATRFFTPVEHPELKATLRYIGPPYRLSETPWKIKRRAPTIGEHNKAIYKSELGLDDKEISTLTQKGII